MSGAGKTQLALDYYQRRKNSNNILASLYNSMEIAAKQLLTGPVFDNVMLLSLWSTVLSSWNDRWLLVFDNLDNPKGLRGIFRFFPASPYGFILVTGRYAGSKETGTEKALGPEHTSMLNT
jgi:hypothetical protein